MKKILIISFAILAAVGCGNRQKRSDKAKNSVELNGAHNSRNSVDYAGTYFGTIPCADCPGIEIRITLDNDGNFTKSVTYIGAEPEKVFTSKGAFEWDDSGSIITLVSAENDRDMFRVGENTLILLDRDGNPITGENADRYILVKERKLL